MVTTNALRVRQREKKNNMILLNRCGDVDANHNQTDTIKIVIGNIKDKNKFCWKSKRNSRLIIHKEIVIINTKSNE